MYIILLLIHNAIPLSTVRVILSISPRTIDKEEIKEEGSIVAAIPFFIIILFS